MCDIFPSEEPAPIGQQIRRLRERRGWTLAELGRRAGTSGPTVHRYENGWDRFEVGTLRKIAAALDARVEIRLVPRSGGEEPAPRMSWRALAELLAPLFWDHDLTGDERPEWILSRVLVYGNREQVEAARRYFGDEALRRAIARRGVDARTRNYWTLILAGEDDASEGPER